MIISLEKGKYVFQKSLSETPFKPDRVSFCTPKIIFPVVIVNCFWDQFLGSQGNPSLSSLAPRCAPFWDYACTLEISLRLLNCFGTNKVSNALTPHTLNHFRITTVIQPVLRAVALYCALPRDYLSDTPHIPRYGLLGVSI